MARNILLTSVGLALAGVMRLAFNAVALRAYGEETAGRLNVAFSMAMLASLPIVAALGTAIVRFMGRARGQGRKGVAVRVFKVMCFAGLIAGILLGWALWGVGHNLPKFEQIDDRLLIQAGFLTAAYGWYQLLRGALYAVDRVDLYARIEVGGALVFSVFLAGLLWWGNGDQLLWPFVGWFGAFSLLALWTLRRELDGPRIETKNTDLPVREMLVFSAFALVATGSSLSVRELAVLVAPTVVGMEGAAYFALGMSLLMPLQILPRLLRNVLSARSAELDGRGQLTVLARDVSEVMHYLALATIPVGTVVVVLAEPLIAVLGGSPTPERTLLVVCLAVTAIIDVIASPVINALTGIGQVKVAASCSVLALVAAAATWGATGDALGLLGLGLGMIACALTRSGLPVLIGRRWLDFRLTVTPTRLILLVVVSAGAVAMSRYPVSPWLITAAYSLCCAALLASEVRRLVGRFLVDRACLSASTQR